VTRCTCGSAACIRSRPAGSSASPGEPNHPEPWRRQKFGGGVRKAREAAGLPEATTFHDLRHHIASVLIAAGCSIKAVQAAVRHANASETLDT